MTAENAPELKPEALTDEDEAAAVAASQPLEMDPVFGPMLGGTPRPLLRVIRDVDGDTFDVVPAAVTLPGEIQSITFEASVRVDAEPAPVVDFRTPARRRLASLVGK